MSLFYFSLPLSPPQSLSLFISLSLYTPLSPITTLSLSLSSSLCLCTLFLAIPLSHSLSSPLPLPIRLFLSVSFHPSLPSLFTLFLSSSLSPSLSFVLPSPFLQQNLKAFWFTDQSGWHTLNVIVLAFFFKMFEKDEYVIGLFWCFCWHQVRRIFFKSQVAKKMFQIWKKPSL